MKSRFSGPALLLVALAAYPAGAEYKYYARDSETHGSPLASLEADAALTSDDFIPLSTAILEGSQQEHAPQACAGELCTCCCERTVPNMIGDSLGSPIVFADAFGTRMGMARHFAKVSHNNNVLPQTRVGFDYNLYKNVAERWTVAGAVVDEADVSEFRTHFERAFFCNRVSFLLTLPVYHTIGFQQASPSTSVEDWEFGNLSFGFKAMLRRTQTYAVSAGLMVEAPTGDDWGTPGTLEILNDEWFLTPYVGWQYTPNDCLFAHGFVSYRARTGTNDRILGGVPTGPDYLQPGRVMADLAVGRWMFRNDCCRRFVTGFAPTVEVHYTETTEAQSDLVFTGVYFPEGITSVNTTLGGTAELANGGTLAGGLVLPLMQDRFPGGDLPRGRSMDWELALQYNQRF